MRHENQRWDGIRVTVEIVTAGSGQTGLSPTARVLRVSDGLWWNGSSWQVTPTDVAMTEVSASNLPGYYSLTPGSLDYAAGALGYIARVVESSNTLSEYVRISQLLRESWSEAQADFVVAGTFGAGAQGTVVSAASIADAVWDEALSGHVTAGTSGAALGLVPSLPSAEDISDTVWDEAADNHTTAGSMGEAIGAAAVGATPSDIADAVWDESLATHQSVGSTGKALNDAAIAATPSDIADAVWDEVKGGHTTPGTFGYVVQVIAGAVQQNHRMQNPTYDAQGRMLSSEIVVFPSSGDADAGTNVLTTIYMTMTYDGDGNLLSILSRE